MRLVGMKDVTLAGQALPALAAIAKALDARQRDADRIGVVAVRRKCLAAEMRLEPLDAGRSRAEPDAAPPIAANRDGAPAQSFKTGSGVPR